MSEQTQTPEVHNQDVVDLLVEQHEQARGLFSELEQATGEARTDAFEQLVRLLAVHETAEEEIVYPAVRKMVDDGDTLADARTAEEDEAKTALSELEKLGVDHPDFDSKLGPVKQLVLSHAAKEEHEVFPELRESHSRDQLVTMARGVRAAESFAPTHPHPRGARERPRQHGSRAVRSPRRSGARRHPPSPELRHQRGVISPRARPHAGCVVRPVGMAVAGRSRVTGGRYSPTSSLVHHAPVRRRSSLVV